MPHLHHMSQTMFGLSGNVWPDLRERIQLGSHSRSQLTSFIFGTMVFFFFFFLNYLSLKLLRFE